MLRLLSGCLLLGLVGLVTLAGWGLGPARSPGWHTQTLVHLGGPPEVETPERLRVVVVHSTDNNARDVLTRALLWRPDLLIVADAPADDTSESRRPLGEHVALEGELTWRAFLPRVNRRAVLTRTADGWRFQRHVRGLQIYSNRTLTFLASTVDPSPRDRTLSELLREPAPAMTQIHVVHPQAIWTISLRLDHSAPHEDEADLQLSVRGASIDAHVASEGITILQENQALAFADGSALPAAFLELERTRSSPHTLLDSGDEEIRPPRPEE